MILHNHQQNRSRCELVERLLAMPSGKRPEALRQAFACSPDNEIESCFTTGELRVLLFNLWEERHGAPPKLDSLRQVLEPPFPIRTSMAFSRLAIIDERQELSEAVWQLLGELHSLIRSADSPVQREFLEENNRLHAVERGRVTSVHSVSDLKALAGQQFPAIYADPPWDYSNRASRGAAVNHYPTMSVAEICAEPIRELAAERSHLHLWTTNAFLRPAFDVIEAWGFEYKSCLVWVKRQLGMGNYWRVSHEYLLLGVRGGLKFRDNRQASWIGADRTSHSRKPAVIRALVEKVSPGPYLELYGREAFPDSQWTVYGNQIERKLF